MRQICHCEIGAQPIALNRSFAHQTANTHGLANHGRLGCQFAGRAKEDDIVFQRGKRNARRQRQKRQAAAYRCQSDLFRCHLPSSLAALYAKPRYYDHAF